jgi:hypothetical protein
MLYLKEKIALERRRQSGCLAEWDEQPKHPLLKKRGGQKSGKSKSLFAKGEVRGI